MVRKQKHLKLMYKLFKVLHFIITTISIIYCMCSPEKIGTDWSATKNILELVKIEDFSWCGGEGNRAEGSPQHQILPSQKKDAGGSIFLLGGK